MPRVSWCVEGLETSPETYNEMVYTIQYVLGIYGVNATFNSDIAIVNLLPHSVASSQPASQHVTVMSHQRMS